MIKPSQYNVMVWNHDHLLIYNTLSENFWIEQEDPKKVYSILSGEVNFGNKIENENFLLNKGFLVEEYIDEFKLPIYNKLEKQFQNKVLEITIMATNQCDFRCAYCYQDPQKNYLSDSSQEKILKYLERQVKKFDVIKINWFGGEPLLKKNIILNCSTKIAELCKKYKKPLSFFITTNGYNLDASTAEKLISLAPTTFQVSLDGTKDTHNRKRPHVSDPDSYNTILKNLLEIKSKVKNRFLKMVIRINVDKEIYDSFDAIINEFNRNFQNDKRFFMLLQAICDWGGSRIDREKGLLTYRDIYDLWNKARKKDINLVNTFHLPLKFGACEASMKNSLYINCDGSVFKCTLPLYDTSESNKQSNLIGYLDLNGKLILNKAKESLWLTDLYGSEKCIRCKFYPICNGGMCPYQKLFRHNTPCYYDDFEYILTNIMKDMEENNGRK